MVSGQVIGMELGFKPFGVFEGASSPGSVIHGAFLEENMYGV